MIRSDIVKIPIIENFDNNYIERKLENMFSAVIRWAVVEVSEKELTLSVSYEM